MEFCLFNIYCLRFSFYNNAMIVIILPWFCMFWNWLCSLLLYLYGDNPRPPLSCLYGRLQGGHRWRRMLLLYMYGGRRRVENRFPWPWLAGDVQWRRFRQPASPFASGKIGGAGGSHGQRRRNNVAPPRWRSVLTRGTAALAAACGWVVQGVPEVLLRQGQPLT